MSPSTSYRVQLGRSLWSDLATRHHCHRWSPSQVHRQRHTRCPLDREGLGRCKKSEDLQVVDHTGRRRFPCCQDLGPTVRQGRWWTQGGCHRRSGTSQSLWGDGSSWPSTTKNRLLSPGAAGRWLRRSVDLTCVANQTCPNNQSNAPNIHKCPQIILRSSSSRGGWT